MAFNRELSQFANYLDLDASANYIGIAADSATEVGIGTVATDAKLTVDGDVKVSGVITATSFDGSFTGNADTATALETARTISLGGDLSGSASFDGTGDVTITGTIGANSVDLGTDTVGNYVSTVADAGSGNITVSGSGSETAAVTIDLADTGVSANTYGSTTKIPVVSVDAKGRVTSVTTASVGTALTVTGDSGSEDVDLLSESLSVTGGSNVTTTAAANGVSVALDADINLTSVTASGAVDAGSVTATGAVEAASVTSTGVVSGSEFHTGAEGSAVRVTSDTISGPATLTLDPAGVGDNTGTVVIAGNLQVDGTQTIVNSTTVAIDDLNVQVATGAANDAAANGGGLTVNSGEGNKTWNFEATGDNFASSENINVPTGKVYKVNNTEVLSTDTLGSGVVNSSLTSVGTLGELSVGSNIQLGNAGVITATSFVGSFEGGIDGTATNADGISTARNFSITGDGSAPVIAFDGRQNVELDFTLDNTAVTAGSYGSSSEVATFTVDTKGRLTAAANVAISTSLGVSGGSGSGSVDLLNDGLSFVDGTYVNTTVSGSDVTIALDATASNTPNFLVARDGSGNFAAGTITAALSGNADTASTLQSARTIALAGDVAGNVSFNGASDVTINTTIQANSVALGNDTTGDYVESLSGTASNISVTGGSGEGSTPTVDLVDTGVAAGTIGSGVAIPVLTVDAKGRITATSTAAVGSGMTVTGDSGSEDIDFLNESFSVTGGSNVTTTAASNGVSVALDSDINLTSVTATTFTGALTGNADSATQLETARTIGGVSFDGTSNIDLPGVNTAGNQNTSGNAATATQLANGRNFSIAGDITATSVSFDGTGNVALNATIDDNAVALGTKTTGNYVATVADSGSGNLTVTGSGSETAAVTLDLADSGVSANSYGSTTAIPVLAIDAKGRITSASTASISTDLTVGGDSGSDETISTGETLTVSGGTNVTTTMSTNEVSVALDSDISLASIALTGGMTVGAGLTIAGDLVVNGTTTTINSTTLSVDDKNIELGSTSNPTDASADGGGITLKGSTDHTFNWVDATDSWTSSENMDLASAKTYKVAGTDVLSATTLGAGVVNSSLTNVGTLTGLTVDGTTTATNIIEVKSDDGNEGRVDFYCEVGNLHYTRLQAAPHGTYSGNATVVLPNSSGTLLLTDGSGASLTNLNASSISSGTLNAARLADSGVSAGTVGGSTSVPVLTIDAKGRITGTSTANIVTTLTVDGDSGSEDISLATEDLTISGGSNVTTTAAANGVSVALDSNINLTSVTATTFAGDLTGDVTGNVSGNAGTATALQTARTIGGVSFDGTANINLPGVNTSGNQDTTGNADTASALQTARTLSISGDGTGSASFDGSANSDIALTLANSGVAANTYGSQTAIPQITVNAKGIVTSATTVAVGSAMTVTGDSGSENINFLTESLSVSGGSNVTTSAASNGVEIALDDNIAITNLDIGGTLTDVNDTTGVNGYVLTTVGTGVSWTDITATLPQTRTTASVSATAGQTAFTFNYNVNYLDVFINGVKLGAAEFTATNGTSITLGEACFAGDIVEFISYSVQGVGTGTVASANDLTDVTLTGVGNNDILVYDGAKFVNQQALNLSGAIQATAFNGPGGGLTGLNASNLASGTVGAARLGSGTADATTFLRGDNTWAVVDSTSLLDTNSTTRVAATTSGATVTGALTLEAATPTSTSAQFDTSHSSSFTYSNNNLTVTKAGPWRTARYETALPTSGKVYIELDRAGMAYMGLQQGVQTSDEQGIKDGSNTEAGYAFLIGAGETFFQSGYFVVQELKDLSPNDTTVRTYGLALDLDAETAYLSVNGSAFYELTNWFDSIGVNASNGGWFFGITGTGTFVTRPSSEDWLYSPPSSDYGMIGAASGGGVVTTIADDGTATFSGNVTASALTGDVSGSISGATGAFTGNVSVGVELRDGDGNFGTSGQVLSSDGTDTAWVNAGSLTAGAAALVGVNDTTANASHYVAFVEANSGNEEVRVDTDLVYNPSTNVLTASSFSGALTGNVTGNVSGSSGSCTGNAATATLATNAEGLTGTPDITVGEIIGTDLTISGDLTVNGTTTTLNTATLEVEDLNITVAKNAASSAAADGAGLTVAGASATFNYSHAGTKWVANKDIEAPNFNATSDITLKDNVSIIDNALEMINNLDGISWNWKDSGKASLGVSAQNVETVAPELVSNGSSHKAVNYNGLVGVLIEAVKSLSAEVETLKATKSDKRRSRKIA